MINLKIPDAAYAAGWEVFRSGQSEGVVTDEVIDAAMPLAFAAELRELQHKITAEATRMGMDNPAASGLLLAALMIKHRITSLDPEELTK